MQPCRKCYAQAKTDIKFKMQCDKVCPLKANTLLPPLIAPLWTGPPNGGLCSPNPFLDGLCLASLVFCRIHRGSTFRFSLAQTPLVREPASLFYYSVEN